MRIVVVVVVVVVVSEGDEGRIVEKNTSGMETKEGRTKGGEMRIPRVS